MAKKPAHHPVVKKAAAEAHQSVKEWAVDNRHKTGKVGDHARAALMIEGGAFTPPGKVSKT